MKGPIFKVEQQDDNKDAQKTDGVGKALRKFEQNQDLFTNYTKHGGLEVKSANGVVINGEELTTSCIDLGDVKKPKIYLHDDYILEKSGGNETVGLWAAAHECEHLVELLGLLQEKDGARIWAERRDRERDDPSLHILDNCLDDVKMNRSVVAKLPVTKGSFHKTYREKLFKDTDFVASNTPKHLQFAYTLLNEHEINGGRSCVVDDDVRFQIDRLRKLKNPEGKRLLDFMTHPDVGMKQRLELQELFFETEYKKFKEYDDKNWQPPKSESGNGEGNNQEQQKGKNQQGGENSDEKGNQEKGDEQDQKLDKESEHDENSDDDVNKKYEELYKKFDEAMKGAIPKELEQNVIEEYIEEQKENAKENYAQQALEAYAKSEGVTVLDLKAYRAYIDRVNNLKNPETDELLIEDIRNIFRRIITERTAPNPQSKLPLSEGVMLRFPARAVVETASGNSEPEVWETIENKDSTKELVGKFDVTLVCDRSGSMGSGGKLEAQRTTAALVLEALREFSIDLDDVRADLEYDLAVRTEVWSFGDMAQCELLKGLSETLSEKERVLVYQKLSQTPGGSTKDFETLDKIIASLDENDMEQVIDSKLRKIIFVISDGDSDNPAETQKKLKILRDQGILVYGIGVTSSAQSITKTYAPNGTVCEDQAKLPIVIGEHLKNELKKI